MGDRGKKKQPRARESPSGGKTPLALPVTDWRIERPAWRFGTLDIDHPEWGWQAVTRTCLEAVHERLKNYETMTWREILAMRGGLGPFNGIIDLEDIEAKNPQAAARIKERRLDSAGALMKLRYDTTGRVWGVMDGRVCSLVWCDPDHTVWPRED